MTEEMITEIGRLSPERLGVISRGSAMRYRDARPDPEVLGRELGVSHVLEGTVRSGSGRVRVRRGWCAWPIARRSGRAPTTAS